MYITSGSFKNLCENKQKSEVSIDTKGYMKHFQRIDKLMPGLNNEDILYHFFSSCYYLQMT